MSAKRKLRDATLTIEQAIRSLQQASLKAPQETLLLKAIRELQEAHELVRRAAREVE